MKTQGPNRRYYKRILKPTPTKTGREGVLPMLNRKLDEPQPIHVSHHPHIRSNGNQLTSVSASNPLSPDARSDSPQHPQQQSWLPIPDPPWGCSSTTACWRCIPPVPSGYPCRTASESLRRASGGGVWFLGKQLRTRWLECGEVSIRNLACRGRQNRPSVANVAKAPLFEVSKRWLYAWPSEARTSQ